MKYARVLLENCPKATTRLFIDYYTGKYKPRIHLKQTEETPAATGGSLAAAASAVQNLTNLLPLPYMNTSTVATPTTQGNTQQTIGDANTLIEPDTYAESKYTPPAPRSAFSSFIDHADEFIVFLEACLEEGSLKDSDKADLYTTLFEMYLHKASEKKGGVVDAEEWEQKARQLIEGRLGGGDKAAATVAAPIEDSSVLLLSHLSDFRDGTTLVKEQAGLLFDIFRSYTAARDTRGAIKALRKYGAREPQLYPAALAYLTSDARVLDEAGPDELANILRRIDEDGLMAPLQVIQTLGGGGVGGGGGNNSNEDRGAGTVNGNANVNMGAVNGSGSGSGGAGTTKASSISVATMGMVKPYLAETIARERREIATNRRQITSFRRETEQKRRDLADLASKPAVFQAQRCPGCGAPLDLPAVHFLCKHSFHQRCLKTTGDADVVGGVGGGGMGSRGSDGVGVECPVCAPQNAAVRAIKRSQEERADRHDLFKDALEKSGAGGAGGKKGGGGGGPGGGEDRFKTVAQWFGQGVMNVNPLAE